MPKRASALFDLPPLFIATQLMTAKIANSDLPLLGFCIVFLLGSEGCAQLIFYSLSAKEVSERYGVNPSVTKIAQS